MERLAVGDIVPNSYTSPEGGGDRRFGAIPTGSGIASPSRSIESARSDIVVFRRSAAARCRSSTDSSISTVVFVLYTSCAIKASLGRDLLAFMRRLICLLTAPLREYRCLLAGNTRAMRNFSPLRLPIPLLLQTRTVRGEPSGVLLEMQSRCSQGGEEHHARNLQAYVRD